MNIPKRLKKIGSIASTVFVILVVLLAALLVGARVFHLTPFCVMSGSMEPEYPVGSLIYIKEVDPSTVEERQVITYRLPNGTPSTHRVIRIDTENRLFYTKGDANNTEDNPVSFSALMGTPVFKIPFVGYAAFFIQHPPGSYLAIAVGAILLLLTFLPDLFKDDKKTSPKDTAERLPK